ncbi:polycystic kidney disease 2-like 2 protein [Pollicipes pollicipes]|uniref:polycystic kidney disease 2-like 2 protein n=1 Tax=Pollicipes pollicipes TaxID=41117 RepID=UPI001884A2A7|nr:polycystic kidney disease 2-like 2 protein [Pollicipes pollicipes]
MTTAGPLGHLDYIRIWHDNSGGGRHAGWYLDKVVIKDLQTELVVSIFVRPQRSNYTRVQRLSVVMALLFLTMCVNAMFYKTEPATSKTLDLGFFKVTTFQIWRKRSLPHWCVYIGWLLVLGAAGTSAFMVFSYSLQWGKEKSLSWLKAMLLSVAQSVFLIQPVKVFAVALVFSILCKKPDTEAVDDDSALENALPADDEEMVADRPRSGRRTKLAAVPIDHEALAKARQKRLEEKEMLLLMKQMCTFMLFLLFLLFLAQQNRNPNAFLVNNNLKNMLVDSKFSTIRLPRHLFSWLKATYLGAVFWDGHYNGAPLLPADRPFMSDMVTLRLGPARVRQVRIKPDQCRVPAILRSIHDECNIEYSWTKEDKSAYNTSWAPMNVSSEEELNQMQSPWVYKSMMDLDGAPHWGQLSTYNGGGFHMDLLGSGQQTLQLFMDLEERGWIDKFTRAVFIEFTVVNVYVNLFSRISLVVEFSNSGNTITSHTITTFQLYNYVGPDAIWIMTCEAIVVLFIIFFFVTEIKKLRKQKMKYFSEFWNTMEFIKIILAITSIAMYAMKNIYVHVALGNLAEKQGEFINMQRMAAWNETFVFLVAFVCFTSILEVLHLLRFNAKMSMLALTLRRSTKELIYFSVTFCITFLAFAQFAFLAFGTTMNLYSNFLFTVENLCTHLLGDIDFDTMYAEHGSLGICFYLVFVTIMTFIVLNMFLAILGDSFTEVKEELKGARNQYELLDFCKGIVMDLLGMSRTRAEGLDPTLPSAEPEEDAAAQQEDPAPAAWPFGRRSAKVVPSAEPTELRPASAAPSVPPPDGSDAASCAAAREEGQAAELAGAGDQSSPAGDDTVTPPDALQNAGSARAPTPPAEATASGPASDESEPASTSTSAAGLDRLSAHSPSLLRDIWRLPGSRTE